MQKWDVMVHDTKHDVIFERAKLSGKAMISVDGIINEYAPVPVKNVGMFYFIEIEDSEIILKLVRNKPEGLIQDGVYLDTGLPLEESVAESFHAFLQYHDPLTTKNRTAMGSFLTFVILTFVNLFLIAINSSISFPFSATVPQVLFSIGWYSQDLVLPVSSIVLILSGIIGAVIYLGLYLLALKRTWPVLTTLILVSIDTIVLIVLSIGDFTNSIIDIAFHLWVLWSIIQLYRTRRRIKKETA